MKTIAAQLDAAFRLAIRAAFDLDVDPLISPSQNQTFGDYQSNAAMSLAKRVAEKTGQKTNPRQVAEQILAKLDLQGMSDTPPDKSWIAGPGFINVRLSPGWLATQLGLVAADDRLGVEPAGTPQTVVIDYSGPNIAKQMHVGHLRSTIIGDAVARTLAFQGQNVIRQNHLGDWGTQFGRVVLAMWYLAVFEKSGRRAELDAMIQRQMEAARALAENKDKAAYDLAMDEIVGQIIVPHREFFAEDWEGHRYFKPYVQPSSPLNLEELESTYVFVSSIVKSARASREVIKNPRHGGRTLAELPKLITSFIQNPGETGNEQEYLAWKKARDVTIRTCHALYQRLSVQLGDPDIKREQPVPLERGESEYQDALPGIVADLEASGVAGPSEGAIVIKVPGYEAPLIIRKGGPDAGYLYGTTDLAAIRYRVTELHANRVIYFVDARQGQHFAQVFWTATAAGWADGVSLEHAAFGTMLGPDGKPFQTRSGDTVKLKDLLDEAEERALTMVTAKNPDLPEAQRKEIAHAVGIGAVKYSDLAKDRTSDYMFSFDAMLSMDGNTAPYMQYAYARVRSIFRKAGERGVSYVGLTSAAIALKEPQELALAKQVLRFGEVIEQVGRELKPHLLCAYLYELAGRYSTFYEACPVLTSEEPTRTSRLALADLTARVLGKGLDLLGIAHPEQM